MGNVYIIAEAACTWEGNHKRFVDLMADAKLAGCDAIKAQWTSDPVRMALRRRVPASTYQALHWPADLHAEFALAAKGLGLDYLCSVFLEEDLPIVAPHVARFKIASLEASDRAFIRAHKRYLKPLLISTGAMTEQEISQLFYDAACAHIPACQILLCTAAYPCPPEQVHLAAMSRYAGLSDHTGDVNTGGFAVAAGAEVLEVHVRDLHTRLDNADFRHSLPPDDLERYVYRARLAARMRGEPFKRVTPSEEALRLHRVVRL